MKLPEYVWKRGEEIAWIALVAVVVFVLEILVEFDPDAISDWRLWAISLGAGCVRAAAGAILGALTKPTQ
jgi:hypothetical protein